MFQFNNLKLCSFLHFPQKKKNTITTKLEEGGKPPNSHKTAFTVFHYFSFGGFKWHNRIRQLFKKKTKNFSICHTLGKMKNFECFWKYKSLVFSSRKATRGKLNFDWQWLNMIQIKANKLLYYFKFKLCNFFTFSSTQPALRRTSVGNPQSTIVLSQLHQHQHELTQLNVHFLNKLLTYIQLFTKKK